MGIGRAGQTTRDNLLGVIIQEINIEKIIRQSLLFFNCNEVSIPVQNTDLTGENRYILIT
jgi:hypothetical protein